MRNRNTIEFLGICAKQLCTYTNELLLVARFKTYSRDVIDAAQHAHARAVPVVAITDFALSPLKPLASVCFELGQGANAAFRSLVAPLCLAQALVVSVGHRLLTPTAPRRRRRVAHQANAS